MAKDGMIALTACHVADGREGQALLAALAEATGCRVTGTKGLVGGQDAESFALHPAIAARPFSAEARAAYAPTLVKPKFLAPVQVSDVAAGIGGFVINGVSAFDEFGYSISNAGDVNGDGLDDLIVGARGDSPNAIASGASFVIFGRTDNSAAVELSNVDAGTGGFVIRGVSQQDVAGWSVGGAGDVNGDGLDDLIVGAPGDDPNGLSSSAAFIVYGKSDGAAVELSALESGTGGVTWNGAAAYDRAGTFVSAAGDVDGDGFDDVIVGSEGASSHVIFGRQSLSGQVVEISDVDAGIGGFAITSGGQVSGVGDLNGDGLDDLLVGERFGTNSYVVFGRAAVDLVVTSDSGFSNNDNVTNDSTPTIAFQADAGTVMQIDWDDGNGFVATGLLQQVTLATPYTTDGVKNIQVRANGATTSADDVI